MDTTLSNLNKLVYEQCSLSISALSIEVESQEYTACRFELNRQKIICRNSKITPKKVGQFVTFWKRTGSGPIAPFDENDPIDFYVVNAHAESKFGQFVFPKSVLIKKGIISTTKKEGKRAFRVYPEWDIPTNQQAQRTQKWQMDYFYAITSSTDFTKVVQLYQNS